MRAERGGRNEAGEFCARPDDSRGGGDAVKLNDSFSHTGIPGHIGERFLNNTIYCDAYMWGDFFC